MAVFVPLPPPENQDLVPALRIRLGDYYAAVQNSQDVADGLEVRLTTNDIQAHRKTPFYSHLAHSGATSDAAESIARHNAVVQPQDENLPGSDPVTAEPEARSLRNKSMNAEQQSDALATLNARLIEFNQLHAVPPVSSMAHLVVPFPPIEPYPVNMELLHASAVEVERRQLRGRGARLTKYEMVRKRRPRAAAVRDWTARTSSQVSHYTFAQGCKGQKSRPSGGGGRITAGQSEEAESPRSGVLRVEQQWKGDHEKDVGTSGLNAAYDLIRIGSTSRRTL
ncbi:hypothetical protein BAUCODRAFT_149336 [Baudoinia panamericana UAMH 10762]|uniref:Uncharacterized protein n=1 Tax=Baudoinia panamericana (strain UAMH 10762) TaxID=717646 RepID=M2MFC2_BAUPA|nr:uncharacterized protein BAUCODRAFT_149336 [Baudoinia panamericana UAMH 10762]EMC95341.1 hypothetical protein BAUCODRAFT_149336 [Baudoinia panamericana UAMH 10762]